MKVYLAVGHGLRPDGTFDPGAAGGGWNEQSAGDYIVDEAARLLEDAGHQVFSEAFSDDPNFVGSTRKANEWGADVVVAVHHDWVGAPEGAFGHWYTTAGKSIADQIQKAVGEAGFPLRPSWHKKRDDLYILKNTIAPCVLYEVGRIGTGTLDTEQELRNMGRAIAAGVAAWGGSPLPEGDDDVDKNTIAKIDAIFAEVCVAKDDKVPDAPSGRTLRDRVWQTNGAAGRLESKLADEIAGAVAARLEGKIGTGGPAVDVQAIATAVGDELKARL